MNAIREGTKRILFHAGNRVKGTALALDGSNRSSGGLNVRIAIHPDSSHEHPLLHHHLAWACFLFLVLMMLLSELVNGDARVTTSVRTAEGAELVATGR